MLLLLSLAVLAAFQPRLAEAEDFKHLRMAAEKGEAQLNLGLLYDIGKGVPEDDGEAVKWYRKAAEQGDPWAQYNS